MCIRDRSQFNFDVQYVPGKLMTNADATTRMPFDDLPFKPPIPAPDIIDEAVIANVSDINDTSMCQDAAFENLEPTSSPYIITFGVNTKIVPTIDRFPICLSSLKSPNGLSSPV